MTKRSQQKWLISLLLFGSVWPIASSSINPLSTAATSSQSPISVHVNVVDLPVSVTDRKGNVVDNLTKDNFRVLEDGQPQVISIFEHQDLPVTVGLVVDHSGSMGPKLPQVSAAAAVFAQSSNPNDQLFVVNFNEMVSLMLPAAIPFTSNQKELESAVAGASARGRTALYDAIIDALDHLELSEQKRQALVIVTDGGDNASQHSAQQVLDIVMKSQAQVFCIGLLDPDDKDVKPGMLKKLAKVSGGEAYFPESLAQVTDISRKIAIELRRQYILGFTPAERSSAKNWRTIRVALSLPNGRKAAVRTRTGYFFSGNQANPASATNNP